VAGSARYVRAAEAGDAELQHSLAVAYRDGRDNVRRDEAESLKWYCTGYTPAGTVKLQRL
jgi:TPR repeat protein